VGKTAIAIALAKHFNTAIVSADSRQCYMGMPIGTAQPTQSELQEVKHYFINAYPVTTQLSAADYEQLALGYLDEIFKTNNTAIVCGGTGLYIKALCDGMDEMPGIDETINTETEALYKELGISWLQDAVQAEDPEFYEAGEIHNPSRLLRALVFIRSTGKSIVSFRTGNKKQRPFRVIKVGLELPREVLYERINKRVDVMMELGLLEEVKALYTCKNLKSLQTVGYSELFDYLDGNYTLPEAIDKIKQHSRNYAKRQMTWFKKDKEIAWFNAWDENVVAQILNTISQ
jgi:tRNA dimethylallyltransferase